MQLIFHSKSIFLILSELFTEAVDDLMAENHELGGSTVVVDRATPKVAFRIIFFPNCAICNFAIIHINS